VDLPDGITAIATGARHSCAATRNRVWCWGDNEDGQLNGVPGGIVNARPVFAGSHDAHRIAAGEDQTCLAPARGEVVCWGDDDFGQLGREETSPAGNERLPLPISATGTLVDRNGDGRITVGCLGDSNTQTIALRPRNWCEMLRDLMPAEGFATVNRAEGGATAVDAGSMIHASDHLDYVLANDAVDTVIAAYGTNDLLIAHASPDEVILAYRRFRERSRAAGVDFFVASTPPTRNPAHSAAAAIEDLNRRIAEAFDSSEIVDFSTDLEPDDYVDELHLGDSGQAKRARAAWKVLRAAAR
jgi:lysophospholipase L1-like esterase